MKGGITRGIKEFFVTLLVLGVLWAILRAFNMDFIAAFEWIIAKSLEIINRVADFLIGNESFVKIFK